MAPDEPEEQTFADVLNGLARAPRSRRRAPEEPPVGTPRAEPRPADEPPEENAAAVRAYAWTGGRTRPSVRLEVETLVTTTRHAERLLPGLRSEHQAVVQLCRRSTSVAEIGALLSLPLGVVRVLLDDMTRLDLVEVHATAGDREPDVDLLLRVLRGLTDLPG